VLHGIFLLWLFHAPGPAFLAPAFVARGDQGTFVAHLYWPNQSADTASDSDAGGSAGSARQPMPGKTRLIFPQPSKAPKKSLQQPVSVRQSQSDAETTVSDPLRQATPAGSAYGTVLEGPLSGYEIRPALPVFSPDPAVDTSDLAGAEGDVIVEITIDEQGIIVQKNVIQSLGPKVDTKVLAALANWHFRPASRNGVPIPSKQDVYYHYPRLNRQ
jgi:protein TonB